MNWSYIAGFFDGEGSICHNGRGYRITIAQTNEDVLKGIASFSGVGAVIKTTKRKKHWKDSWVYYIASQEDVYIFLKNIKSFLVVKKDSAQIAMAFLKNYLKEKKIHRDLMEKKIKIAESMRIKGCAYRRIGKTIKLDWGYVRRILMRRGIH